MANYYICSIGEPGKGYDDENLRRCIVDKSYRLHEDCERKGSISKVKKGDLLILKYQDCFIAYGRASSGLQIEDHNDENGGWNHRLPVDSWFTGNKRSKYGVQNAQKSVTPYDTVKEVERTFALKKIEEIGLPF